MPIYHQYLQKGFPDGLGNHVACKCVHVIVHSWCDYIMTGKKKNVNVVLIS